MAATAAPASVGEALGMLEAAMDYLAGADATAMPTAVQARCLLALERADAVEVAARARVSPVAVKGRGD